MSEMEELLEEFIAETAEHLAGADLDLLELESNPDDFERVDSLFRAIHTIKGTCGFLGFDRLSELTHGAESLLNGLRDRTLALSVDITTALLQTFDAVRAFLDAAAGGVEASGVADAAIDRELIAHLANLVELCSASDPTPERKVRTTVPTSTSVEMSEGLADPLLGKLRVDVELVDRLMDLVGELVLTRNQMMRFAGTLSDAGFADTAQRLDLVTTELQDRVMQTRMQPISTVWRMLPRMVREISLQCGKRVEMHIDGVDVDLDKTVIDAIRDPLVHIVRNAIDHGIEMPEDRELLGKSAVGRLRVRTTHERGQVVVEVSDDGRGLDIGVIRERAIERRLVTPEAASRMSEDELSQLIFAPGFSTARTITSLSGRGVGMDVVKTNVEAIGGVIDVRHRQGGGTTVTIQIPLTLAIVPALIVADGGLRYAIPQVHLRELVAVTGDDGRSRVEFLQGVPVFRLRGRLLPVLWLRRELCQSDGPQTVAELEAIHANSRLVVLEAAGTRFGLVVEAVFSPEEIVVKSLGPHLFNLPVYAGATIMGDGSVAMILDLLGLAQRAAIVTSTEFGDSCDAALREEEASAAASSTSYLVVETVNDRFVAMQLEHVLRLERLPSDAIESAAHGEFVQYRGEVVPLYDLARMMGVERPRTDEPELSVIVTEHVGRAVAVRVTRILDIVHEDVEVRDFGTLDAVVGSAVIRGRVTDVIDLRGLLAECQGVGLASTGAGEELTLDPLPDPIGPHGSW